MLGLARNARLQRHIADALEEARAVHEQSGRPERVYRDFDRTTRKSWSQRRRVVAKAEQLRGYLRGGKSNPRFVVSDLPRRSWSARRRYE